MNYEKAYKEALERAKRKVKYNHDHVLYENDIIEIFPELEENHEEKVKRILHSISSKMAFHLRDIFTEEEFQCFDAWSDIWLEKQAEKDEQKPVDKIEPKFKEGDWVVYDNKIICHIDSVYQGKESLMYTITDTNNFLRSYSVRGFDAVSHIWTLQDAKPGAVLVSEQFTFLFSKIGSNDYHTIITYANIDDKGVQATAGVWIVGKDICPATKEQRELFLKKLGDAGYKWDPIEMELKKMDSHTMWNQDDEDTFTAIKMMITEIAYTAHEVEEDGSVIGFHGKLLNGLKSYKERLLKQPSISNDNNS